MNWPQFDPEAISIALFNLLKTIPAVVIPPATGTPFDFETFDRRGQLPQNVPPANQPYLGLVELGMSQVENQAQGLEKWLLHFRVLVYIRADATPSTVPATELNGALKAVVDIMRSVPVGVQQTLGGIVDNAWIEGEILMDTGILDQQCALLIPIVVDCGL